MDSDQMCQVAKVKAGPYLQSCDNIWKQRWFPTPHGVKINFYINFTAAVEKSIGPLAGAVQIKYIHVHILLGVAAGKARKSVSLMHTDVNVHPMNVSPEFGWNLIILQCHQRSKVTILFDWYCLKHPGSGRRTLLEIEPPPYLQTIATTLFTD